MTRKKQRLKKIKLWSVLLYETRYDEKFRFPKRKKERRKTDIRHATNNIVRFIDKKGRCYSLALVDGDHLLWEDSLGREYIFNFKDVLRWNYEVSLDGNSRKMQSILTKSMVS